MLSASTSPSRFGPSYTAPSLTFSMSAAHHQSGQVEPLELVQEFSGPLLSLQPAFVAEGLLQPAVVHVKGEQRREETRRQRLGVGVGEASQLLGESRVRGHSLRLVLRIRSEANSSTVEGKVMVIL